MGNPEVSVIAIGECSLIISKLRELGTPNQIVDDLDFKLSKFNHRLRYESDSKLTIVLTIAISI